MQSHLIIVVLLCTLSSNGASHDPFPVGYCMGNNGTIVQAGGPTGRQPWTPACFYKDTFRFGVSVCGVDYYDIMDNLQSSYLRQVVAGAWYSHVPFTVKASFSYFNALGLYYEQEGYCSLGYMFFKAMAASCEITGYRAGLMNDIARHRSFLYAGASLFIPSRFAAFSISCNHVPIKSAPSAGFIEPINVIAGLHTTAHSYGAQGILCEIRREGDYTFRFSLGESYCIGDHFSVCGALSTNPFMLYFGVSVSYADRGTAVALVNHPALGWSKSLTLDYAHR